MGVPPPVLTRRPFEGKYHYPQTCHRHTGSNPIFTALSSRKCVHAAWLISLINVPNDLHIQLLKFSEGISVFPKIPSLSKELEGLFFYPHSKKIKKSQQQKKALALTVMIKARAIKSFFLVLTRSNCDKPSQKEKIGNY